MKLFYPRARAFVDECSANEATAGRLASRTKELNRDQIQQLLPDIADVRICDVHQLCAVSLKFEARLC